MKKLVKEGLLRIGAWMWRDDAPKVVYYHDVGRKYTSMGTPADLFKEHVKLLRKDDIVCFDDGFRGIWDHRDLFGSGSNIKRAIVFLAVGLVGKDGYLNWDEIRTLQDGYGIDFQCHTWSHQTLAGPWIRACPVPKDGRTDSWFHHELSDSRKELEARLGKRITSLCFPVGYFSSEAICKCKAAGYEKVYASYPGNICGDYVQPRCLAQDLTAGGFSAVLRGGMNIFCKRYRKRHLVVRG